MSIKYIKTVIYAATTTILLSSIISCEDDFTDIGTSMVSNGKFTTSDTVIQIQLFGKNIESVQTDGLAIGGLLGQYLLGVYNNPNYKKIEASIISQLAIPQDLSIVDREYGSDTLVITSMDTVLLRIPYNASLVTSSTVNSDFTLDSIIGDQSIPFTLNVYRLATFLSTLNPEIPAIQNRYFSDHFYDVYPEKLNFFEDTQFKPNSADTAHFVSRILSSGVVYDLDTITYFNGNPTISIPIKKNRIKELFFDQYQTSNFTSQETFNNYFRGIKIQAESDNGSLMSLTFNDNTLSPLIDIYYTNTVLTNGGTTIVDTIKKNDIFFLSGIRNNTYKMTSNQPDTPDHTAIQGTAGSMVQLKIFGDDTDMNGIPDDLEALRAKDWLVNDAEITLYVDQEIVGSDTLATPFQLFVFKDGLNASGETTHRQIIDYTTEGVNRVGGQLQLDDHSKPDSYTFKITDYVSELLSGEINDLPLLGVRVFNPTDLPVSSSDTIVRNYNWNPKVVMLLNQNAVNMARRPQLKISYSKKTEYN